MRPWSIAFSLLLSLAPAAEAIAFIPISSVNATDRNLNVETNVPFHNITPSLPFPVRVVQNNSSADRFYEEGLELLREGSAASLQQAIEKFSAARELYAEADDRASVARCLNYLGSIAYKLSQYPRSIEYYNLSLEIWQDLGDRDLEAIVLNELGSAYIRLGNLQTAADRYQQALDIRRDMGDRTGEAYVLFNLGSLYHGWGRYEDAIAAFEAGLPIFRETGDREWEAAALSNLGNTYRNMGRYDEAIESFGAALPIIRELGNRFGEAIILTSMGVVYEDLGQPNRAIEYYDRALPLQREIGDRVGVATLLSNLGNAYQSLARPEEALEAYQQALIIQRETGHRAGEATTLTSMGGIYNLLEQRDRAIETYTAALEIQQELGNRYAAAITLASLGTTYGELGDLETAMAYLQQALPLQQDVGDRPGEVQTLSTIAGIERRQGNIDAAIETIEAAIEIIEAVRADIGNPELRSSYFATQVEAYQFYIYLLMEKHQRDPEAGYDTRALHASERSRARSLLDLLTEAHANIRQGIDPQLVDRERQLQQQLNLAAERQRQLHSSTSDPNTLDALATDIDLIIAELQQVQAQIRETSPRYAALTQPEPLTVDEIRDRVLDDDTILLQYSLGDVSSFLWVVTKEELYTYILPPKNEIEPKIEELRTVMLGRNRNSPVAVNQAASQLSEIILAPAAEVIGDRRLAIVPDGKLYYIPFAALTDPTDSSRFLIENHEIVNLPSASALGILRRYQKDVTPTKAIAILADPVFGRNDPRVGNGDRNTNSNTTPPDLDRATRSLGLSTNIARLPATRNEASTILALADGLETFSALDFAASRDMVLGDALKPYRFIHFATHGFVSNTAPELSGIVLSLFDENGNEVDGFLRLHDIFNLDLNAELVVLSACQTGLGESVKGEGIVGITRGFMYAGSPRLLVSLWSVDDEGTAQLMSAFYHNLLAEEMSPARALRAAQLELMQQEQWRSPYYWSAFVLQGEWQRSGN